MCVKTLSAQAKGASNLSLPCVCVKTLSAQAKGVSENETSHNGLEEGSSKGVISKRRMYPYRGVGRCRLSQLESNGLKALYDTIKELKPQACFQHAGSS